jgi:hypothetical protein
VNTATAAATATTTTITAAADKAVVHSHHSVTWHHACSHTRRERGYRSAPTTSMPLVLVLVLLLVLLLVLVLLPVYESSLEFFRRETTPAVSPASISSNGSIAIELAAWHTIWLIQRTDFTH